MSALPAWLWSTDATQLLWANPTGAAIFEAPISAAIRASMFGSRGPAAIQVARLAASLRPDGTARLEQLRGLGTGVGGVLTCACSCITLADQTRAILVAATEPAGTDWPLAERVRRLLAQCSEPIAAFASGGKLIHASIAARIRLAGLTTLAALGAETTAAQARRCGRARGTSSAGPLTIERVEAEAMTILIAIFGAPAQAEPSTPAAAAKSAAPSPPAAARRSPLRFVWHTDAEQRFTLDSEEFMALAGRATTAVLGRSWPELATALALDPEGQIALALASRNTWSGLTVAWPAAVGSQPIAVELSGLPVFDRERIFRGYRGFGICRDVARTGAATAGAVPAPENVVALHPSSQPIVPALSARERNAFQELTRQLHERLTAAAAAGPQETPQDRSPPNPAPDTGETDAHSALARAQAEILALKSMLDAANRQAAVERASAAKSEVKSDFKFDFLAKISHEIRSPLNTIIGFSEIMAQERFGPVGNERYRQYLGDIQSSGAHLMSLINDLINLSKIEAGKLELEFAELALNFLTRQCIALLQPQANRARIIIRASLSPTLPAVSADAGSLREMVLNLISNSVQRCGAGGLVIVSTTLNDKGEVVLRVRDNGSGMSEPEIARALEPFGRSATLPRPSQGGAGLGLPLGKALAEANRATWRIRSAPGAGTLIEVVFPPERVSTAERP